MESMREGLKKLLSTAFYVAKARDASSEIEMARRRFAAVHGGGAFSFEVSVPEWPLPGWVTARLVRPLVYFAESYGSPLPECPGIFVSLTHAEDLYFIAAGDVIRWAKELLGLSDVDLWALYGAHEAHTAVGY